MPQSQHSNAKCLFMPLDDLTVVITIDGPMVDGDHQITQPSHSINAIPAS
jgi:hypothetical protein